ncbi:MAG: hypothetical protein HZB26_21195 [Candidatus Hydrogenedentes bacterium]|nr:hypothetical protein [Candidatus Hydrogenedentota bacterium]
MNRYPLLLLIGTLLLVFTPFRSDAAKHSKPYAKMSLEKLMALHMDAKAKVDRDSLMEVLYSKLADVPTEQLLKLRQAAQAPGPRTVADPMFPLPSLQERIKEASFIVHGRVTNTNTEYFREDLIRDILMRQIGFDRSRVTIDVVDTYPKELALKTLTFTFKPDFCEVGPAYNGLEYLFVLQRNGDTFECNGILAWFSVNEGKVKNVTTSVDLPLEGAWQVVAAQYAAASGKEPPPTVALELWLAKLDSDSLDECIVGMSVLSVMMNKNFDSSPRIMDAVERIHERFRSQWGNIDTKNRASSDIDSIRKYGNMASAAIKTVTRLANPASVDRMYRLNVDDVSNCVTPMFGPVYDGFDKAMVALVAAAPGPSRAQHLKFLFTASGQIAGAGGGKPYRLVENRLGAIKALAGVPGDDITALLLDMKVSPDTYRIQGDYEKAAITDALAARHLKDSPSK